MTARAAFALVFTALLGLPSVSTAASSPALSSTATGKAVVRPVPAKPARAARQKPRTAAQVRADLRRRIVALQVELTGLDRRLAAEKDPKARTFLQMRIDAVTLDLLDARRSEAALKRRVPRR